MVISGVTERTSFSAYLRDQSGSQERPDVSISIGIGPCFHPNRFFKHLTFVKLFERMVSVRLVPDL